MVQDKNKGIAEIQYNHLNMPTRITYDNGNMIDYLYSASGAKLKVTHTTNKLLMVNTNIGTGTSGTTIKTKINRLTIDEPSLVRRASTSTTTTSEFEIQTTDYINGYILSDGTLSQIQMNGGYMTEDANGKAVYHFYLQDHQGNNRVVVNGTTLAVEQVNHYYPYGGLFAESTGGEKQPFKYNGKELDRMCGLNWYDHGARHNDAAIGRWHCIDPQAASFYDTNPYCYCLNNPVNCVDEDGECPLWLVTCSVGAIAGAVISGSIALYEGKSGREVMAAAAGGAVAGAIAGTGAGLITGTMTTATAAGIGVFFSGVGSGAGNCVEQGISKGVKNIDMNEVVVNTVIGGVLGTATGAIGGKIAQAAELEKSLNQETTDLFKSKVVAKTNELLTAQKQGISFTSNNGTVGDLHKSNLKGIATSIVKKDVESVYKFKTEDLSIIGTADPVNPLIQKSANEILK